MPPGSTVAQVLLNGKPIDPPWDIEYTLENTIVRVEWTANDCAGNAFPSSIVVVGRFLEPLVTTAASLGVATLKQPGTYEGKRIQWGHGEGEWVDLPHPVTLLNATVFGWRAYTPGGVFEIDTRSGSAEVRGTRG